MQSHSTRNHRIAGLVFLLGAAVATYIGVRTLQRSHAADREVQALQLPLPAPPEAMRTHAEERRVLEEKRDRDKRVAYMLFLLSTGLVSSGIGLLRAQPRPDTVALRRTVTERSDAELIEGALIDPGSIQSGPRAIYRRELQRRFGDLDAFVAQERARMGRILSQPKARIRLAGSSQDWAGQLSLSTRGAGAICQHSHFLGAAGALVDPLSDRLSKKKPRRLPRGAKRFPLPLLARVYPRVLWFDLEQVQEAHHRAFQLTLKGTQGDRVEAELSLEQWQQWRAALEKSAATT